MNQKNTHLNSKINCTTGRNSRKRKHRIIIGGAFSFVFQFLDVFETVDTPILVVPGTTKFMVSDRSKNRNDPIVRRDESLFGDRQPVIYFVHPVRSSIRILQITTKHHKINIMSHRLNIGFTKFIDRKSTRLNSSHVAISYAVFCLKKKKQ